MDDNIMRPTYRKLGELEKEQLARIKDIGLQFYTWIDRLGNSREVSLAKTRVEEAVMWATKHITK